MFTTRSAVGLAMVLALSAGCDPYGADNKGAPQINRVLAIGGDAPVEATPANGVWTLAGVAGSTSISVQMNKLLDGASIQATADNCTPAAGAFTFDGTAGTGTWYACYVPNSANPDDQGGSVVFYNGTDSADTTTGKMPAGPFTIRGQVRDRQGNPVDIAIDVTP